MACACTTRPLTEPPAAAAPSVHPDPHENFGDKSWRLLNERAASAASTDDNHMAVSENRPAEADPPPQPETSVDAAFYLKLQVTLEVIFVSGWGVFIQQFQFNELDNHMSKLEKGQKVSKSTEKTAVDLLTF